jgi:hypothetical protein
MINNNDSTIKKTDWYNDFYSKKQLLGNYFWYEGVIELFAYHQIDLKKMHLLEIGCGGHVSWWGESGLPTSLGARARVSNMGSNTLKGGRWGEAHNCGPAS